MFESKADFARRMGWKHRSTATRFAKLGKIVLTADGQVDVEASQARLAATADPRKEGVRQRHARDRESSSIRASSSDATYQLLNKHRAAAEANRAELLRLELEEKQGRLVDAGAVRKRAHQTARAARDAVMNLRYRIDPLLAGETDPAKRAEIWDRETRQVCEDIVRSVNAPLAADAAD